MKESEPAQTSIDAWGPAGPKEALRQIAELCQHVVAGAQVSIESDSFAIESKHDTGLRSVLGRLADSLITVDVELVQAPEGARVAAGSFFTHLSGLGEKGRLIPRSRGDGSDSLWVELRVQASPMSIARASAFTAELRKLDDLAKALQSELPATRVDADLNKLYQNVCEYLEPISPWCADNMNRLFLEWAQESVDFLSGTSIAISTPYQIVEQMALSVLAEAAKEAGTSIGRVLLPSINSKGLVELVGRAPGVVVVPALGLSLGTSPYELGSEMQSLLSTLASMGCPTLFTGSFEQLQAVFHGGQGGATSPLSPIVRRVPDIPIEQLTRFSIDWSARRVGGIPKAAEDHLARELLAAIEGLETAAQLRMLPALATRAVRVWANGRRAVASPTHSVAVAMAGLSETFAGLSDRPRATRSPEVQDRFTRALTDPGLKPYLEEHLLAQDDAIEQLVDRLRMECLTRPSNQPLRYCAQGTPGTGKSESAALLARKLGVPYINIDAASIPDYYTAAAQLLGSGRGIVGSHQSGRLEQAAKHHSGVLVEVSDLDHAKPAVRSALADLFLQVLETGEAQSATGSMFSCANIIFAFTMNLPEGMDEAVRKSVGFENSASPSLVKRRVVSEIKRMLSSAFLSRIGTPILFEPLSGTAFAAILERAIAAAVRVAAERLGIGATEVTVEAGVGKSFMSSLDSDIVSSGARALLEHGRGLASAAVVDLRLRHENAIGRRLVVSKGAAGGLAITIV